MKSKIIRKKDVTYPCLMESENQVIVLMTAPGIGVVVGGLSTDSMVEIGELANSWIMESFKP